MFLAPDSPGLTSTDPPRPTLCSQEPPISPPSRLLLLPSFPGLTQKQPQGFVRAELGGNLREEPPCQGKQVRSTDIISVERLGRDEPIPGRQEHLRAQERGMQGIISPRVRSPKGGPGAKAGSPAVSWDSPCPDLTRGHERGCRGCLISGPRVKRACVMPGARDPRSRKNPGTPANVCIYWMTFSVLPFVAAMNQRSYGIMIQWRKEGPPQETFNSQQAPPKKNYVPPPIQFLSEALPRGLDSRGFSLLSHVKVSSRPVIILILLIIIVGLSTCLELSGMPK